MLCALHYQHSERETMKRVLFYSRHSLFSEGIKALIDQTPDLEVVGWETDVPAAIERCKDLQPDTLLMVCKDASESLMEIGHIFWTVGDHLRIIELTLQGSEIWVYSSEHMTVQGIQDVVKVIESPE